MDHLLPQKRIQQEKLDEEMLETWESFAARFGRVCDIFLSRYLRTLILIEDPGFFGTLRDFLNAAEKMRLINIGDSAAKNLHP